MAAYTAGFMTHVTCRLTAAKNRDQLRNPTLGNQVWATFYLQIVGHTSEKYGVETMSNVLKC